MEDKRRKIIRTVLWCVVYDSCAQWYLHLPEQFLKMSVGLGLGLFLCICLGLAFYAFFCFSLDCFFSYIVCFCCVRFSFFRTMLRDWLGRTSPKWPILCQVGFKTLTKLMLRHCVCLQQSCSCCCKIYKMYLDLNCWHSASDYWHDGCWCRYLLLTISLGVNAV